jgi:hypothetical protein
MYKQLATTGTSPFALLNQIFQENSSVLALFVEVNGYYMAIIPQVPSDRDGIKSCPGPK